MGLFDIYTLSKDGSLITFSAHDVYHLLYTAVQSGFITKDTLLYTPKNEWQSIAELAKELDFYLPIETIGQCAAFLKNKQDFLFQQCYPYNLTCEKPKAYMYVATDTDSGEILCVSETYRGCVKALLREHQLPSKFDARHDELGITSIPYPEYYGLPANCSDEEWAEVWDDEKYLREQEVEILVLPLDEE